MPIRSRWSIVLILSCFAVSGQTPKAPAIPANYDEALAGSYTLPDPLVLSSGKRVGDAATWYKQRRPEILRLVEANMHGRSPGRPSGMTFDVFDKSTPALDGKAIRKQVTVHFSADKAGPKMDLALYLPAAARTPAPVLLCLNFSANSNSIDDPGLKAGEVWSRERKKVPASSGRSFGKLNVGKFLEQGFGVATIYYGHRAGLSRRRTPRGAGNVPEGGTDRAGAGRMGRHRSLGLGAEPGDGLPGDR